MKINEKIRQCREALDISQAELAKRCGWKGQSRISGYERGEKQPPLKAIKKLEEVMGLPSGYLTTEEDINDMLGQNVGNILRANKTTIIHKNIANSVEEIKIPTWKRLLQWMEANRWNELMDDIMQDIKRPIIPIGDDLNKDCFPLCIEKDSMIPRFNLGDYIIVDPHKKPSFGSFVVARILDTQENLFAQYFQESNEITLGFTNANYPKIIKASEKIQIIGVVVRKLNSEDVV